MKQKTSGALLLRAALVLVLGSAVSRSVGVLYSAVATDIQYSASPLPSALYYLRQILAAVSYGGGIAATAASVSAGLGGAPAILHSGVLLADALAAFCIDAFSGAVSGAALPFAAIMNLSEWLFASLFVAVAYLTARRMTRRGRTPARICVVSAAFYLAGRLLLLTQYQLRFLKEVDFRPYPSEIVQICGEYLQFIFIYGGVISLSAVLFLPLFLPGNTEKHANTVQ